MTSVQQTVLVVEDERDIRELMVLHLMRDGYRADAALNGEDALSRMRQGRYDLLIFDWMLPGISGLELAKSVQKSEVRPPVLMVTARVDPSDIVAGLEAGADDYVTKPFEIPVFLARVRALLRRASLPGTKKLDGTDEADLGFGPVSINVRSHSVVCNGAELLLTPSEFKLLVALARNRGRVLTRSHLIDMIQGSDVTVIDRTVDTHVFGLRKKLGTCGEMIETVRGVGYRINEG